MRLNALAAGTFSPLIGGPYVLILHARRREPTSYRVARRRRRHVAQELITAVTFDCGKVVRDQPVWPFDCDLDAIL